MNLEARYNVGDTVELTGDFKGADPTGNVFLVVTLPDGTPLTFTDSNSDFAHSSGSGIYVHGFTVTMAGRHVYRWHTDVGSPISAIEGAFTALAAGKPIVFTYSGDPAASALDRVRFELGDTNATGVIFGDQEILATLASVATLEAPSRPLTAAASLAWVMAARYARQADASVGDVSRSGSSLAAQANTFAEGLQTRARRAEGASAYESIPAGNFLNTSTLDDADRFRVGEMDDHQPGGGGSRTGSFG